MPFTAVCPVCSTKDRVDDELDGQHVVCSVCLHRYIARVKRVLKAVEVEVEPDTATHSEPPPLGSENDVPTGQKVDAPARRRVRRRTGGKLGLSQLALALGCSALSFAAFVGWTYLPLILGACGLVAAVMSLVLDKRNGVTFACSSVGSLTSTVAFIVVALKAGGPRATPPLPEEVTAKKSVVFPGGRQLLRTPQTGDWVDATKHAVEVNGLYVGVAASSVENVQFLKDGKPAGGPEGLCLVVHLRVVPAERIPSEVHFTPWSDGGPPSGDTPTVTDASGKKLTPVSIPRGATFAKHVRHTEFFPAMYVEDVLVFPAPEADGELRLTVPAEALGGVGPVRFVLPTARIGK